MCVCVYVCVCVCVYVCVCVCVCVRERERERERFPLDAKPAEFSAECRKGNTNTDAGIRDSLKTHTIFFDTFLPVSVLASKLP